VPAAVLGDTTASGDGKVPDSSGGAHEAPEPARSQGTQPSAALRGYTDQFEVLKMPRRRPASPPPA